MSMLGAGKIDGWGTGVMGQGPEGRRWPQRLVSSLRDLRWVGGCGRMLVVQNTKAWSQVVVNDRALAAAAECTAGMCRWPCVSIVGLEVKVIKSGY